MQCHIYNNIWCVDFRLVLNTYKYMYINNPPSKNKVLEIIETYSYVDSFRELLLEDLCRFTRRKKLSI